MPMTNTELFKHRLKNVGPIIISGLLFGASLAAFMLMAVSDKFTKLFVAAGVIACIIWWIGSTIYWNVKIQKAEEARKAYEESERKRRASLPVSVAPRRSTQVLFDYDKH